MPLPKEERCTYAEYAAWDTEDKYELFDGVPVMQARPNIIHQHIQAEIITALKIFLRDKPCRAFAEIEVLLPDSSRQGADDVRNVFIPDISVICEPEKLTKQYCKGAPTVIMEILSPATAKIDRFVKLNAYQKAGVPEYWIISPGKILSQSLNCAKIFTPQEPYTTKKTPKQKYFPCTGVKLT